MDRHFRWLLLGCILAIAPRAGAQQPEPPTPDLGAEAGLHFDLGVRAYSRGDFEGALEHLLLSNRLAPNRKVVFNIARAYEGLGDARAAWSAYAEFSVAEPDPALRAPALEAMERLEPDVALVQVVSEPSGAAIYVDRRDLGVRGSTPRTLPLRTGRHRILVEAPGYEPAEVAIDAELGATRELSVQLEPRLFPVRIEGALDGTEVRRSGEEAVLAVLPEVMELPVGTHLLELSAPGYRPRTVSVEVEPETPLTAQTEPLIEATGTVVIGGPVKGARLEVDGEAIGFLPTVTELPVGPHSVRVVAPGYRETTFQVDVFDGETTEVTPRLVPRTEVVAASREAESLLDAPNTVVVIEREDLRGRGYTDLPEVIADLPGFDSVVANGVTYLLAYQRGYRTPQTQRTLLLTDGREDNLMWSQSAELSRQFPLSDVERVEVLYGPASAVYGPNAFLGVLNVVTVDPRDLDPGQQEATVQLGGGSWRTGWVDGSVRGRVGPFGYSVAGRGFASEEPDLSGRWGFVTEEQLSDPLIWGPLLDRGGDRGPYELHGQPLGEYADPSEDWAIRGRVFVDDLELGYSRWVVSEGYGPYYATDRTQSSPRWTTSAERFWAVWETDLGDRLHSRTLVQRKNDRIGGSWAEASPDGEFYSFVSLTEWNAPSHLWEAREQLTWQLSDKVQAIGGFRWVRKDLTRGYDVPGYWDGFSSQPVANGSGIVHSSETDYEPPPPPLAEMPPRNRVSTDDVGGYGQVNADVGRFRFFGGLRSDYNSAYGVYLSPRAGAIFRFADDTGALKLLYGHAFQEPSARQLYGEWDGRGANPNLRPEAVDSLELVAMRRTADVLLEGSVYGSLYEDVIKEEAQNAGQRQIVGAEARMVGQLPNPVRSTEPMDLFANLTVTATRASQSWDPGTETWVEEASPIGDIAPVKANAGVTLPMLGWAAAHLRTNVVGSRLPYSRNPLRAQGERFAAYALVDAMVSARSERWDLGLHVDNLFDAQVLQPGAEGATAGNDFSRRSAGYHNSAIPLAGRSLQLVLTLEN